MKLKDIDRDHLNELTQSAIDYIYDILEDHKYYTHQVVLAEEKLLDLQSAEQRDEMIINHFKTHVEDKKNELKKHEDRMRKLNKSYALIPDMVANHYEEKSNECFKRYWALKQL